MAVTGVRQISEIGGSNPFMDHIYWYGKVLSDSRDMGLSCEHGVQAAERHERSDAAAISFAFLFWAVSAPLAVDWNKAHDVWLVPQAQMKEFFQDVDADLQRRMDIIEDDVHLRTTASRKGAKVCAVSSSMEKLLQGDPRNVLECDYFALAERGDCCLMRQILIVRQVNRLAETHRVSLDLRLNRGEPKAMLLEALIPEFLLDCASVHTTS